MTDRQHAEGQCATHGVQQIAADAARAAIAGLDEDERRALAAGFIAANAGNGIAANQAAGAGDRGSGRV